jgi:hypothetical protein
VFAEISNGHGQPIDDEDDLSTATADNRSQNGSLLKMLQTARQRRDVVVMKFPLCRVARIAEPALAGGAAVKTTL